MHNIIARLMGKRLVKVWKMDAPYAPVDGYWSVSSPDGTWHDTELFYSSGDAIAYAKSNGWHIAQVIGHRARA